MAKYDKHDTSQSPFKTAEGSHGPRCTERVPRTLYGPVGMPPRCTLLDGPHGDPHRGDHRATFTLTNVGKVIYKWKRNMPLVLRYAEPLIGRRSDQVIVDEPIALDEPHLD